MCALSSGHKGAVRATCRLRRERPGCRRSEWCRWRPGGPRSEQAACWVQRRRCCTQAAFPPHELSALAWIALVPLFSGFLWLRPRDAAAAGLVFGLVGTIAVGWWLPGMLERYFAVPSLLSWAGFLAVALLVDGLPYAALGAWTAWARSRGRPPGALVLGAGFVVAEWLRSSGPVANPFALLAYSQHGTPFAQLADLAGPWGIGWLIAAANAALAGALLAPQPARRRAALRLAGAAAVVAAGFAYGVLRLAEPTDPAALVRVAVVQTGIARDRQGNETASAARLEQTLALTRAVVAQQPDLRVLARARGGLHARRSHARAHRAVLRRECARRGPRAGRGAPGRGRSLAQLGVPDRAARAAREQRQGAARPLRRVRALRVRAPRQHRAVRARRADAARGARGPGGRVPVRRVALPRRRARPGAGRRRPPRQPLDPHLAPGAGRRARPPAGDRLPRDREPPRRRARHAHRLLGGDRSLGPRADRLALRRPRPARGERSPLDAAHRLPEQRRCGVLHSARRRGVAFVRSRLVRAGEREDSHDRSHALRSRAGRGLAQAAAAFSPGPPRPIPPTSPASAATTRAPSDDPTGTCGSSSNPATKAPCAWSTRRWRRSSRARAASSR